jgi:hypothetical protein
VIQWGIARREVVTVVATRVKRDMAKKKTEAGKKDGGDKSVIYLEVPPQVKEIMERLAREHNRKLTGECIQALQDYMARYEAWPPKEGGKS